MDALPEHSSTKDLLLTNPISDEDEEADTSGKILYTASFEDEADACKVGRESNGKEVSIDGQHSFYQLIHQNKEVWVVDYVDWMTRGDRMVWNVDLGIWMIGRWMELYGCWKN
ncbi:hypothetical protein L1049_007456 [Liquidambar formosana]|uniref:Uncharacterized protein n=1 Tax=Liquidambar formosana TaxID=63359 RepID=A0AAP0X3Z1_LIQFO